MGDLGPDQREEHPSGQGQREHESPLKIGMLEPDVVSELLKPHLRLADANLRGLHGAGEPSPTQKTVCRGSLKPPRARVEYLEEPRHPEPEVPVPPDPVPLLQELIRSGRDGTCKAVVEVVKARCRHWRVAEGPGFVWVQPGDRAGLVLSGHLDVVPAGEGWSRDAFAGEVAGEEVWGRGACDMKGAIAAMLSAAEEAGRGDWALALTTDEETGMAGARALSRSGALEGADLVLVGEPTGMDLGVGHRGGLWLEVETRGKEAHGGKPQEGDNAVLKMLKLLQAVEGFELPQRHGLLGGSTLNVGALHGGEAFNVVPAQCTAKLDLRVPPPASVHGARKALEEALGKAGIPFQSRVFTQLDPFEARPGPLLDRVRHWLREANPQARDIGLHYGTEAAVYQQHAPCVVAGPGRLDFMHVRDERVGVAQLRAAQRFYLRLLKAWS